MIAVVFGKKEVNPLIFIAMIWFLAFQNPLESVHCAFAYIDELIACFGLACCILSFVNCSCFKLSKGTWGIVICLVIFAAVGLLGNLLFRYQTVGSVLIDFFTNLKFFFAISAGYYLLGNIEWEQLSRKGAMHARLITLVIVAVFFADRILEIWPGEIRYGIKSATLFFSHPTYLAGAMAFLLVLLTAFFEKRNILYLAMNVCMMALTLRSKAIASAAVFAFVFLFFVVMRKKLKLGYLIVIGIACLVIGWPLFNFYYVQLAGKGARAVLTELSFTIMLDYFPIGTGFGTYASSAAAENFSKVYEIYNLEYLMRFDGGWRSFLSDTFWPIIIGQTGAIGLCTFVAAIFLLIRRCFLLEKYSAVAFAGALYIFIYLIISSTSEPAFHNAVAIPLALVLGILFAQQQHTEPHSKGVKNGR